MSRSITGPAALGIGPLRGSVAVACGLITMARLCGPGWRRLLPDVYLRADAVLDHVTWCQAALVRAPDGSVLGFRSALALYCPNLMPDDDAPVDVIVPRSTSLPRNPRLRTHRMRLDGGEVCARGGMPVTSPARTAFDLARSEDLVEAVVCVDALLNRGLVTVDEIAPYTKEGRPGSLRAARVLELCDAGAESPMETRTRLVLVLAGLPRPCTQHEVVDGGVFVARLDMAYPRRRLGVEYDGDQHRERAAFRSDATRANRLRLCGWTVLRFTVDDVFRYPARLVEQVRAALRG